MTDPVRIEGPSAKTLQDLRRKKAKGIFAHWRHRQGEKIKASRPEAVFAACWLLAIELSDRRDPLILTAEEITMCEQRAISSARSLKHGPVRTEAEWRAQCAAIRDGWAAERKAA